MYTSIDIKKALSKIYLDDTYTYGTIGDLWRNSKRVPLEDDIGEALSQISHVFAEHDADTSFVIKHTLDSASRISQNKKEFDVDHIIDMLDAAVQTALQVTYKKLGEGTLADVLNATSYALKNDIDPRIAVKNTIDHFDNINKDAIIRKEQRLAPLRLYEKVLHMIMGSYDDYRDEINLDISHRCTLECSGCLRQSLHKLGYDRNVGGDMRLEDFAKVLKFYRKITFCGQNSDPLMHPKFIDILQMIKDTPGKKCSVHTAISQKRPEFYKKAFEATGPESSWYFGLDGMPEDSHKYRKNQDGKKLWDMMLLARSMGVQVVWQFLIFNYNENYIEEAANRAFIHGMTFLPIRSSRFDRGNDGTDPNNHLKPTEKMIDKREVQEKFMAQCLEGKGAGHSRQGYLLPCCWCDPETEPTSKRNKRNIQELRDLGLYEENMKIENNESIDDIIKSDTWMNFFERILTQKDIPMQCQRYCKNEVFFGKSHDRQRFSP